MLCKEWEDNKINDNIKIMFLDIRGDKCGLDALRLVILSVQLKSSSSSF